MALTLIPGGLLTPQAAYAHPDIPGTTGGGLWFTDPVVVSDFRQFKAALQHDTIRYVRVGSDIYYYLTNNDYTVGWFVITT
jgi:hypothetical protein